jgi:hypothetical protein
MQASVRVRPLLLVIALLAPAPAAGGPLQGVGSYVLLTWDGSQLMTWLDRSFAFTGSDILHVQESGPLGIEATLMFDPDPLGVYELVLSNGTGTSIEQGSLTLSFEIPPTVGGPPAYTSFEAAYADTGGGGIDESLQHALALFEDVGPGWITAPPDLILGGPVSNEEVLLQEAGPVALPGPGHAPQYDEMLVQVSFSLGAGDTVTFRGAATFPDPVPVCGDEIVDPRVGEECDPPDGSSCGDSCLFVPEPDPLALGVAALASLCALARQRACA